MLVNVVDERAPCLARLALVLLNLLVRLYLLLLLLDHLMLMFKLILLICLFIVEGTSGN